MEKEQTNKEKLEAAYRTQIHNLNQEVAKQKQANVTNNETSLARMNFQENTIYNLQKEIDYYKNELEKMKKINHNQGTELGHKSQEISNYITNEAKHNEKIKELFNKIQRMTEIQKEYKIEQEEYIMQIADLQSTMNKYYKVT